MKPMTKIMAAFAVVALIGLTASQSHARLRLVALPDRDNMVVNLDNPTVALVQEERILTLQEGINQVDFSWKGVRIDESSIRFRPLTDEGAVTLLSVSYPPGENALVWEVYCPQAIDARVRIKYLLSGIDQVVTYTAVADREETEVSMQSYLVLRNFSGEDFEEAKWLLGYGQPFESTSRHEETKRSLLFNREEVPIGKEFTWDAAIHPHDPSRAATNVGIPVHYVIKNDADSNLGEHELFPGKVRVFQRDGHGSTIFLGEDRAGFTPVGDEMRLYIGNSRDIVVTQRRIETRQENIQRNTSSSNNIVLYDEVRRDLVKVEHFRDSDATLNIIQHMEGHWEMVECSHEYEMTDYKTLKFEIDLEPQSEVELTIIYRVRNIISGGNFSGYSVPR